MSRRIVSFALAALLLGFADAAAAAETIDWRPWSAGVFAEATRQHKLVLLDLGAVWCHWCHVMEDVTYRDPEVVSLINQHYVAVRADEDASPDLTRRYINYGWPATILFDATAVEIVKRRGYVEPETMRRVLKESFDDPSPNPNQTRNFPPARGNGLTSALHDAVLSSVVYLYDRDNAGWGDGKKYLDPDVMEFALGKVLQHNRVFNVAARHTLQAAVSLIDPVWGGVYQYSESPDWKTPHFEKILSAQSTNIRDYAYAYEVVGDEDYLKQIGPIVKYVDDVLTDADGGFYSSQDADLSSAVTGHEYYALSDTERRKFGVPRIDKAIYTNENADMASALLVLYRATGDQAALKRAIKATHWLLAHRSLPEAGGFAHGEKDTGGPFLADALAMARASLDLYAATADRIWLREAQKDAKFILAHFADKDDLGYFTADPQAGGALQPFKEISENVAAARFFNLLSGYAHDERYKSAAISALRSASASTASQGLTFNAGLLLADDEIREAPTHLTVVGAKQDPLAQSLFKSILALPPLYKLTEWQDPKEGKLPGADIEYPELPQAAAFVCTKNQCSPPATTIEALRVELARSQ